MTRLLLALAVLAVLCAVLGERTADGAGVVDVPVRCGRMGNVVYCYVVRR